MRARPLLLGHRGARALKSIPENTLASFDRVLADGCDGFEFDVRLTSDLVPVVCHDPKTARRVIAQTPADQLHELPRLEEVLERYQSRAFLDIELKVSGMEKLITELLRKRAPKRGFVLSSFLPSVIKTLHDLNPSVPLGLICETKAQLARWPELPFAHVIPHHKLVREDLVEAIHTASRKVFVWTVNNEREMLRFAKLGVDGIISDDTAKLAQFLR